MTLQLFHILKSITNNCYLKTLTTATRNIQNFLQLSIPTLYSGWNSFSINSSISSSMGMKPTDDNYIPRKFREMMRPFKKKEKKQQPESSLSILPGESLRNFKARVNEKMVPIIQSQVEKSNPMREKRKAYLEDRKKKKKKKNSKKDDEEHFSSVKFGQVVQQPPKISAKPKPLKSKNAEFKFEKERQRAIELYRMQKAKKYERVTLK